MRKSHRCSSDCRHDAETGHSQSTVVAAGVVDRDRVAVSGGSHGGFLTGNLLGRHAGRFKAGLARNPVMDLSLMIHVSDIPDWCYVEALGVQVGTLKSSPHHPPI